MHIHTYILLFFSNCGSVVVTLASTCIFATGSKKKGGSKIRRLHPIPLNDDGKYKHLCRITSIVMIMYAKAHYIYYVTCKLI